MHGPNLALEAIKEVAAHARLAEYQPYRAARAELLETGAHDQAREAYEIAIGFPSATPPSAGSRSSVGPRCCLDLFSARVAKRFRIQHTA